MSETLDLSIYVKHDGGNAHMDLAVEGVGCAGCIRKIESGLKQIPGIVDARLNFTNRRLAVQWLDGMLDAGAVIRAIERIGYRAHPFEPERAEADEARQARRLMRCLAVAGFAAMNIMLLSVSVWSGNVSDMTQDTRDVFHWLSALIALPTAAYAGRPFFESALRAIQARQLNMDVPISLGVLLALGVSMVETASHAPHAYFDSAVMLLFFLLCGRYLDHAMRRKTRAVAGNLAALKAEVAHRFDAGGEIVMVPAAALKPGDRLLVRPGERVPADGTVISGRSEIDDSLITGETTHRGVGAAATIYAGGLNYSGTLTMRVTAAGGGTLIDEVERLLQQAVGTRSRYLRLADRAARLYAPMVHTTAALTAVGWLHRRCLAARFDHHGDRRADHHLSLRAGAGNPGGSGRRLRGAAPLGHHLERRRRHRAPGGGRHGRVRQDRHPDLARAAGRQCRRLRAGHAGEGRAAGAFEPPSPGRGGGARGARSHAL